MAFIDHEEDPLLIATLVALAPTARTFAAECHQPGRILANL